MPPTVGAAVKPSEHNARNVEKVCICGGVSGTAVTQIITRIKSSFFDEIIYGKNHTSVGVSTTPEMRIAKSVAAG